MAWSTVTHDDGPSGSPQCLPRACGVSTTSMMPPLAVRWTLALHRWMLGVPVRARLDGAADGEERVLLPRAAHKLKAWGRPALAEAVSRDGAGQARAVAHRAHDAASGAADATAELLAERRRHGEPAGRHEHVEALEEPVGLTRHHAA